MSDTPTIPTLTPADVVADLDAARESAARAFVVTGAALDAITAYEGVAAERDAARALYADANAALAATSARLEDLERELGEAVTHSAELAGQLEAERLTVTGLLADIEVLRTRIDELEGETTPPPPPPVEGRADPLLIGAAVAARNGKGAAEYTSDWEAELGVGRLDIVRRFVDSVPTNLANTWPIAADLAAGRNLWISLKGGASASTIAASLRTLPHRANRIILVALHHEPDNDMKQGMTDHTPEWFAGRLAALGEAVDTVRAEGRTDIAKSFILTGYLDHDGKPGTSEPWFPEDPTDWVYGIDPYDPESKPGILAEKYAACVEVWRAHGGQYWAVAETGTKLTGTAGAAQVDEAITYCEADPDCVAFCYFHSPVGDNGPWWMDDPATRSMFAEWIRDNRAEWPADPWFAPAVNA